MARIGFMQGRLSPQIEGKIQAFPWQYWETEFLIGSEASFESVEWTLDADRMHKNPLLTEAGQKRIRELSSTSGIHILSLTGDCFMQAPFWKASKIRRRALLQDLKSVLEACSAVGIRYVVVPLVDNGSLENNAQRQSLLDGLLPLVPWLLKHEIAIVFESDYAPEALAQLITSLPDPPFGINYDIGNSASLGFDPAAEIRSYGNRIRNVHVKDRLLGGTTVPLGTGAANFRLVFRELGRIGYQGDFILQTARATDGDHLKALLRYREMVRGWLNTCSA
jgi:L-ribulose-5-phosphate 3-epimerase